MSSSDERREHLTRQALRIHLRYAREAVEALDLCPWAAAARTEGRVDYRVILGAEPQLSAALDVISEVASREDIDVGLVIFPELPLLRLPFSHFVAEVRAADAARWPLGKAPLAMADFHPDASADTSAPERLVPFVRSAPDPTIQLVRRSALEAVRMTEDQGTSFVDPLRTPLAALLEAKAPAPPLALRVARNNLKTVQRLGVAQVEAIFQDILRDRDASYAALGYAVPQWAKART